MRVLKFTGILAVSALVLTLSACNPNPVIESVDPKSGSETDPTLVTVKGKNFKQGAKVTVDGLANDTTKFVSATSLTAELPASAPAQVKIGVQNPGGAKSEKTVTFDYMDTTVPSVMSMDPMGGTEVDAATPVSAITVTYSEDVDPAAVISVTDDTGATVEGTGAASGTTVVFTPTAPLAAGKTYNVTVSGVKDAAGNAASADYTDTFTIKKGKK